jgi:hypothetical protein
MIIIIFFLNQLCSCKSHPFLYGGCKRSKEARGITYNDNSDSNNNKNNNDNNDNNNNKNNNNNT